MGQPRTPRPKLTLQQYDRIVELREGQGWSCGRIARALSISLGRVKYACLRDGIEAPATTAPGPVGRPTIVTGGGRLIRRFTPEEDQQLEDLRLMGVKPYRIATLLERRRSSVVARLLALARHAEQAARFATRRVGRRHRQQQLAHA